MSLILSLTIMGHFGTNSSHSMTIIQIQERVSERKPVSQKQVFRYLKVCKIKPAGLRQRPQQYPDDAADRILETLGLKIVSMNELRDVRRRAKSRLVPKSLRRTRA